MDLVFFESAMEPRLRHLAPRSSPTERVRNQLLLIAIVFGIGAGLRTGGFGWTATILIAGLGGLAAGVVGLELYERAKGIKRQAPRSEELLPRTVETVMRGIAGEVPEQDRGVWATSGGSRTKGRTWTLTLRTDLQPDSAEVAVQIRDAEKQAPPAIGSTSKPALPVEGIRYPVLANGVLPVVAGAWLQVDVHLHEDDPAPEPGGLEISVRGPAELVLGAIGDDAPELGAKALAAARKAVAFNAPWAHQLRYERGHLVIWTPLTEACSVPRVRKLIDGMGALHAQLVRIDRARPRGGAGDEE